MGDPVAAHTHLEQATALYAPQQSRTLAFSRGTDPGVVSLSRLAWTLWWLGYPDRALARSLEAIELAQCLPHLYSLIFALQYHAHLHVYRREAAHAKERFESVMSLMRENGFVQFWRGGMTRLGWILVDQGAIEEGIVQILQGLDAERIHGVPLTRCSDLVILAQAYVKAGAFQKGLRVVAEALEIARNNAVRHYEPELYRLKGELLLQADLHGLAAHVSPPPSTCDTPPTEEAEACFQQAIDLAGQRGAKSLELRAVMSLSRLWQRQGKHTLARQRLAELYGWFTEGFDTSDLQEAKSLLEALQ
jgi:predicted ATPase